jgi:hypothetical protein
VKVAPYSVSSYGGQKHIKVNEGVGLRLRISNDLEITNFAFRPSIVMPVNLANQLLGNGYSPSYIKDLYYFCRFVGMQDYAAVCIRRMALGDEFQAQADRDIKVAEQYHDEQFADWSEGWADSELRAYQVGRKTYPMQGMFPKGRL